MKSIVKENAIEKRVVGMSEREKDEKKEVMNKFSFRGLVRQAVLYLFVIAVSVCLIFLLFKWDAIRKSFQGILRILAPVIAGLVIAYVLLPVVEFVERRLMRMKYFKEHKNGLKASKMVRGLAVAAAMIFAVGILFILGYLIIPQLVRSIAQIIVRFPLYTQQISEWFSYIQSEGRVSQDIENFVNQGLDYFLAWMQNDLYPQIRIGINTFTMSVMNVLQFFYNLLIGAIISIYVMMSAKTFTGQAKKFTYAVMKPDMANGFIDVIRHCNQIFGGFISGKLIDSAIIGVVCFIVLNLIDMPYAMLVSVIVGVTNIIPFFGPYIGAIPSLILISLTDLKQGIIFLIFIIILQQIDGNILGPKILGNSTGLSPFWVVFAILVGGGVFGFPGMLLGVPVFGVFYYLIKTFVEYALYKKRMPLETKVYIEAEGYDSETGTLVYCGNGNETRKERREKYGSYKNISIERDKKREEQALRREEEGKGSK